MSVRGGRPTSLIIRATQRGRHELVLKKRELLIIAGIVVVALIAARFWELGARPGLEWDEPVYASVAQNLLETGELRVKQWVGSDQLYLYHPPFYFYLLAAWFTLTEASVESARLLTALGSLAMLALVAVMLRRHPGGRSSLVLLGILALDGWLLVTNRVALIENLMLPIGVAGLVVYQWALADHRDARQKTRGYVIAGLILGFAAVFKHTGAYLLAVPVIHWFIIRRDRSEHLRLMTAMLGVVVLYVVGMVAIFGEQFWDQYRVQLLRSLGLAESRGSVGLTDLVRAAIGTYLPFVVTVTTAGLSAALVAVRTFQAFRARTLEVLRGPASLYYAWAVAGIGSFGVLGIRLPQYFMLVFVPLYMYAGSEVVTYLRNRHSDREYTTLLFVGALALVLALNAVAFTARIVNTGNDAIGDAAQYISETYSPGTLVLADEPIGVLIPQQYLQMDTWAADPSVSPDVVVTITSLTQQLPESEELSHLLGISEEVYTTKGFKEDIVVYETP